MMKPFKFPVLVLLALVNARAHADAWQPSPGHEQIAIWPGVPPGTGAGKPLAEDTTVDQNEWIGGKHVIAIHNVSTPTITVYAPNGKSTGTAVVVFPGGGYEILAMDLEGTEVCDWLTSIGVTCVLLKYRVPETKFGPYRSSRMALQDAQRAVGLTRFHAAEWHIDPHKIGVLGFSAGGHMVAAMSTQYEPRLYPAVDAADKESCRPDFAVALYPGHLWGHEEFKLNPDIRVTRETPPTFLLQAEDDQVDPAEHSLVYYRALKKANVPVEMHLYPKGGHAFGLRRTNLPITWWPQLVETWLGTLGMTAK